LEGGKKGQAQLGMSFLYEAEEDQVEDTSPSTSGACTAAAASTLHHPLGDGRVRAPSVEVMQAVDAALFAVKYRNKKPVLLRGAASSWRATKQWHLDLASLVEEQDVEVLVAHDNRSFLKHELCEQTVVPLKASLDSLLHLPLGREAEDQKAEKVEEMAKTKRYLRLYLNEQPHLEQDVELDALCHLFQVERDQLKSSSVGVWVSSPGCETPMHFDLCHGCLAQIVGRKRFLLVPPQDAPLLAWPQRQHSSTTSSTSSFIPRDSKNHYTSPIDVSVWLDGTNADVRREHPSVDSCFFSFALLEPGDVLYTPPGWWHLVTTMQEGPSVSVLVPFDVQCDKDKDLPHNVQLALLA